MAHELVLGTFDGEEKLLGAARAAREGGLAIHDTYVPYAVHGLTEAMGLSRSRLGEVAFWLGLTGLLFGLGYQLYASAISWPLNIGGKSVTAIPALIPIAFELMVLFAAVGTVIVFLFKFRLWPGQAARLFDPGVTDDRFVLALEAGEGGDAREFLAGRGALEIRRVEVDA